ncbi:MAG TPA: EAL domain-containing protein, partial [Alphaproteobacteria bacterium]|nr:EAL domain-containing protein [Alphaproteobacteria bacterium]
QVAMATGEIVGVEALARWNHPEKGPLSPRDFIPVAEKTGTIMALGHWVLNEACRQLRAWRDEGIELPEITLNLSLSQLRNSRELVRDVADTTEKWGLDPSDIEFDVTEAMLAQATWTQNDVLAQLRQLGCKIAIDDFGTEYSSFDYLRSYSVNHLKIAQSFINKAIEDPERAATIRAIIHLARDLGIGVIAEGVETEEQRSLLLSIGQATHAQGYYYSKAVSPEAADEMLHRGHIAEKSKNKGRDENGKGGDKTDGDDDKGSDDDSGGSASQPAESGA